MPMLPALNPPTWAALTMALQLVVGGEAVNAGEPALVDTAGLVDEKVVAEVAVRRRGVHGVERVGRMDSLMSLPGTPGRASKIGVHGIVHDITVVLSG